MTSPIIKIKKNINEMGALASLLYTLSKLIGKLSKNSGLHYYLFVTQKTQSSPRLPAHRGKNFKFQTLASHSPLLEALPRPSEVINNRFNQGSVCITATKDEQFVGCIWLSLHSYIEDEVRAIFMPQPANQVAWDYDVFIAPEYRATYLFPKLWDAADNYLISQGYEATTSRISGFNTQSINSHKKLGAKIIAKAVYIKLCTLQLSLSTVSPHIHLSFSEKNTPKYKLR